MAVALWTQNSFLPSPIASLLLFFLRLSVTWNIVLFCNSAVTGSQYHIWAWSSIWFLSTWKCWIFPSLFRKLLVLLNSLRCLGMCATGNEISQPREGPPWGTFRKAETVETVGSVGFGDDDSAAIGMPFLCPAHPHRCWVRRRNVILGYRGTEGGQGHL